MAPSNITVVATPDALHQAHVEVAGDEGAAAEAHDGHAGGHAAPVGKPLHERADRRDVAEPAADAADDAHAEEDEDALAQRQPDAADQQPGAEEERRGGGGHARAAPLDPRPAERGAQAEQRQRRGERGVGRAEPPRRVGEERLDRPVEGAPRVHRSDAHVHEHGAHRNDPAILRRI